MLQNTYSHFIFILFTVFLVNVAHKIQLQKEISYSNLWSCVVFFYKDTINFKTNGFQMSVNVANKPRGEHCVLQ